MNTVIQKWGNSHGVRLPKIMLEELGMTENDRIEITVKDESIVIKKTNKEAHKTVGERLSAFYGKPLHLIGEIPHEAELDTGKATGEEVW